MGDGNYGNLKNKIRSVWKSLAERKNGSLLVLIFISGFFYLFQFFGFPEISWTQARGETAVMLPAETVKKCVLQEKVFKDITPEAVSQPETKIDCASQVAILDSESKEEKTKKEAIKTFEQELYGIVGGHPIRDMVPFIAPTDRRVAAFIVGIARKESSWGLHKPTRDGQDCYNYWGYKGAGSRGTAMGYACFATPEEAVKVVGGRIAELVGKKLDTPARIVVWKCGSSCAATGGQAAANKWISDVDFIFQKITKANPKSKT